MILTGPLGKTEKRVFIGKYYTTSTDLGEVIVGSLFGVVGVVFC